MTAPRSLPHSTYRLQLTADFPFDAAVAVAPQLKELGITHVYASPFLKARRGSTHGYDVVDHTQINPELGGEEGFERFSRALKDSGLGLILDFVPNHMGVHFADNPAWLDLLEWGPKSRCAQWFDIEWDILPHRKRPGVLLPILGASYGETLMSGDIKLSYDGESGDFSAWYFEHRLPITPARYPDIIRAVAAAGPTSARNELLRIASLHSPGQLLERTGADHLKQTLRALPNAPGLFEAGLHAYRAGPDRPEQTHSLHSILERQHYRLAHWQLAASDINYRRFFDINTLAGLAVENRATFDHIHSLVRRLIREDKIQGLRLDHIDGLRDPAQYFQRLNKLIAEEIGDTHAFYVLVEKILGDHEPLRRFVGVHGTTGYEWLNVITQILVEPQGLRLLGDTWRQATNGITPFSETVQQSKRRVIDTLLSSEFTVLVRLLTRIAAGHYSTRDFSEDSIRQALELFVVHFPIYRTYITGRGPNEAERRTIDDAIAGAQRDWFGADNGIFDFLRKVVTLDLVRSKKPSHSRARTMRFTFKLQQFTGPLMAKGLEDTAFYRHHRLIALNEVGGNPASPGLPIEAFHQHMRERSVHWPHGLTATATHDTKRGEDARTRLAALSELAGEWTHGVGRWKIMNAEFIRTDGNRRAPSLEDEFLIYQSILGAMPIGGIDREYAERIKQFAIKAIREAKLSSSWLNPNAWYEDAVTSFIEGILNPETAPDFVQSISALSDRLSLLGALNSLSQLTLKAMMPGVPDFYQGTEFWDFALVDPDNRRPVDVSKRALEITRASEGSDWPQLQATWRDGRLKLHWTRHLLALRNSAPDVFAGSYVPIAVEGKDADRVIAFARRATQTSVLVIALRHMSHLTNGGRSWPDFRQIDARIKVPEFAVPSGLPNTRDGFLDVGSTLDSLPAGVILCTSRDRPTHGRKAAR